MTKDIFGVNPQNEDITPEQVRDAMCLCFYLAHKEDADMDSQFQEDYCLNIVKKFFSEEGFDFDRPTKAALTTVIDRLAQFSKNFRTDNIINHNAEQIRQLVETLD